MRPGELPRISHTDDEFLEDGVTDHGIFQRSRTLTEQAADQIRERIVKGSLALGEALSESAVAAELGVSKTPVREAFMLLKAEGLVDIFPQRGTFVFRTDASDARKLSEFRELLEIGALRLALGNDVSSLSRSLAAIAKDMDAALAHDDRGAYRELDARFHQKIIDYSDNDYLSRSHTLIAFRIQALRYRLALDPAFSTVSLRQHHALAHLIADGRA